MEMTGGVMMRKDVGLGGWIIRVNGDSGFLSRCCLGGPGIWIAVLNVEGEWSGEQLSYSRG